MSPQQHRQGKKSCRRWRGAGCLNLAFVSVALLEGRLRAERRGKDLIWRPSSNGTAAMFCVGIVALVVASVSRAEDWPAWHGPKHDSRSQETGLPVVWNDSMGVVWKTDLPEWGNSTPAIWGDAIFLTSQKDDALLALRLNKRTGAIEWTRQVGSGTADRDAPPREKQKFNALHNLASPSPATDGKRVVVHFGNGDLVVLDLDGRELWRHNLQEEHGAYTIWWGHANSPVLFGDLVISACMQDSLADRQDKPALSYLVAHDLQNGQEKWLIERMTGAKEEHCDSYTTPILMEVAGKTQLIVLGGEQLDAYDPATGKQLWVLPGIPGGRTITGPTPGDGLVYATQGMRGPLLAVKTDGQGKLSHKSIAWKYTQGTPDSCCPVVWGDLVFTVTDDGIAHCFDAYTGQMQWKQRLKGEFKASPLAAEGRIYFLNSSGLCTVVAASKRFERLAENQLSDTTLASPAVSGGRLFIRGHKALFCLGEK